jgi:hypothetical protein
MNAPADNGRSTQLQAGPRSRSRQLDEGKVHDLVSTRRYEGAEQADGQPGRRRHLQGLSHASPHLREIESDLRTNRGPRGPVFDRPRLDMY